MNTETIQPHNQMAAATWNAGGEDYERISAQIADAIEHCVRRLAPKANEQMVDVATGTGWAARRVAATGAQVVGIDIGEDLIESAKTRAAKADLEIDFRVGDAEKLPLEDGSFDGAISTFGVMFASRPEAAAAELARVVRKGGRIAITTWLPDSSVAGMFKVMKAYMSPPPTPAPPSPFEWGNRERVSQLLGSTFELGFETGVSFCREPDAEACWQVFRTSYGPTKRLHASLDPSRRESLKREFMAFHEQFKTALGITMPREYLVTAGIRK
jgi:SAM-dependent methyltransferase